MPRIDRGQLQQVTAYFHATSPRVLRCILQSGAIKPSDDVRADEILDAAHIPTRDRGKPGSHGVYARFLVHDNNDNKITKKAFGTASSRGVRIKLNKHLCETLNVITASLGDYKGASTGIGDLRGLNKDTAFNAEICFEGQIPVAFFDAIFVEMNSKPSDVRRIAADKLFDYAIKDIYFPKPLPGARLATNPKGAKTKAKREEFLAIKKRQDAAELRGIKNLFIEKLFTRVTLKNKYYKFERSTFR